MRLISHRCLRRCFHPWYGDDDESHLLSGAAIQLYWHYIFYEFLSIKDEVIWMSPLPVRWFLLLMALNYLPSSLNRPVFSIYSTVFLIILLSPSSTPILIPCTPTLLLSSSLSSSYNSQFSRKWSTVSFPAPHSHSGVSIMLIFVEMAMACT